MPPSCAFKIDDDRQTRLIERASFEIDDSIQVLTGAGLHPTAATILRNAHALTLRAIDTIGDEREALADSARKRLTEAKERMVES